MAVSREKRSCLSNIIFTQTTRIFSVPGFFLPLSLRTGPSPLSFGKTAGKTRPPAGSPRSPQPELEPRRGRSRRQRNSASEACPALPPPPPPDAPLQNQADSERSPGWTWCWVACSFQLNEDSVLRLRVDWVPPFMSLACLLSTAPPSGPESRSSTLKAHVAETKTYFNHRRQPFLIHPLLPTMK